MQLSPGHRRHYREVDKARPNFTTGKCQTPDRLTIRPPKNRPAQIKTLAIIGAGKVTAIGEDTAVPKARDGQIYSQAGQAISPREVPPEGSAYWPQVLTNQPNFYGTSSLFASSQPKLAKSQGSEVFLPNNHSLIFRFASPHVICLLSTLRQPALGPRRWQSQRASVPPTKTSVCNSARVTADTTERSIRPGLTSPRANVKHPID